jgi:hypothetical protein
MYASTIPKILPKDTQKLSKSSPFPRYFIGDDSAYMLVVRAIVNPKLKPYPNLMNVIKETVLANKKRNEKRHWRAVPSIIRFFLPCLSESFPLVMEPEKMPR